MAVHGMAAGGAFYWLNEADIVVCSADATFFDPHLKLGKLSSVEPIGALGRIPYQEISRMVLMADEERISAETALRISLVTEITTEDDMTRFQVSESEEPLYFNVPDPDEDHYKEAIPPLLLCPYRHGREVSIGTLT